MKRFISALLVVAVLLAAALGVAQYTLERRLTSLLTEEVLPDSQRALGVGVSIRDSGLSVLGGYVHVNDLSVANPTGFVEPALCAVDRLQLNLGLKGLLSRSTANIARLQADGAALTLVRNKDKQFNLGMLGTPPPADPPPLSSPRAPPSLKRTTGGSTGGQSAVSIGTLVLDSTIRYIDYHLVADNRPLDLTLKLTVFGTNITTGTRPSPQWGTVAIRGAQASDNNRWVTRLDGRMATIADPMQASFDLEGQITAINAQALQPYLEETGLLCEELDINISIVCRHGKFDPQKSTLSLNMRNVTLTTNLVDDLPDALRHMDSLVLPLPLAGTLAEPQTDVAQAVTAAALATLKQNPTLFLKTALKELLKDDDDESDNGEDGEKKSKTRDLLKDIEQLF